MKKYYSERNDFEESYASQDDNSDAKRNIRALLESPSLAKKQKSKPKEEESTAENKKLFDYEEKQSSRISMIDHENTIDQ
jgi:hypothetical protein